MEKETFLDKTTTAERFSHTYDYLLAMGVDDARKLTISEVAELKHKFETAIEEFLKDKQSK